MNSRYELLQISKQSNIFAMLIFIFSLILSIESCRKDSIPPPEPEFILKYTIVGGDSFSYRETPSVSNRPNVGIGGVGCTNLFVNDSLLLSYANFFADKQYANNISITLTKRIHKNKVVQAESDTLGCPYDLIEENDFVQLFAKGIVQPVNYSDNSDNRSISLSIKTPKGSYRPGKLPQHYPWGNFEIVEATKDFNLSSLYYHNILNINGVVSRMITLNFSCKLYNESNPNDSIVITNGVYQGVFVSRN